MPGGSRDILEVKDLVVHYFSGKKRIHAVNHVSLTVHRGEIMGVVGESGSGKSTLAMAVMRILPPNARIVGGHVFFDGVDMVSAGQEELRRILWRRMSIIPQAALNALNPVLKIKSHFYETARAHGVEDREWVDKRALELMRLLNLDPERVWESYPHELSGGMKQRVLIALAMLLEPEFLILDEPTTALDVLTQRFILDLLKKLHEETKITMMFITHDISVIADIADRVAVMYAGKIMEVGDVYTVFKEPFHPYSLALMKSIPSLVGDIEEMKSIPGSLPDLSNPPPGCLFAPRCERAMPRCRREEPPIIEVKRDHYVSCWLYAGGDVGE